MDALGAWEVLECTFEMLTERSKFAQSLGGVHRWNIDSNKGGNFIIGDGCIHFLMVNSLSAKSVLAGEKLIATYSIST